MKSIKDVLVIICILLTFAACGEKSSDFTNSHNQRGGNVLVEVIKKPAIPGEIDALEGLNEPFQGKIAIISISGDPAGNDSAIKLYEKFGDNKIIHIVGSVNFITDTEYMKKVVNEIGEDSEVKAIVINQTVPGTTEAFEQLRQSRKDIFIVFISLQYDITASAELADICMNVDYLGMSFAMVDQAQKMGAETFIYYSRTSQTQMISSVQRNIINDRCNELDIAFVEKTAADFYYGASRADINQFIGEDVPLMVEKYGKNTAFFATEGSMQFPLIEAVVEVGAIFPQPAHPSPDYGFPSSLNLTDGIWLYDSVAGHAPLIEAITEVLAEKDMLGRMSSWPEDPVYTMTNAAVEYTIRYLNGEAPREVDAEILRQIIVDNVGVEAYLTPYVDDYPYTENGNGKTYNNFLFLRMDYITFE